MSQSNPDYADPTAMFIKDLPDLDDRINQNIANFLISTPLSKRSMKNYTTNNQSFIFSINDGHDMKGFWSKAFKQIAQNNAIEIIEKQPNWKEFHQRYILYLLEKIKEGSAIDDGAADTLIQQETTEALSDVALSTVSAKSTGPRTLSPSSWQEFDIKYQQMTNDNKQQVPNCNELLEDIVYKVGQSHKEESLAHSFIVDFDDLKYREHLSSDQIKQLAYKNLMPIPPTSSNLNNAINEVLKYEKFEDALRFAKIQLVDLTYKDEIYPFYLGLLHACNNFELGIYNDTTLSETDIMSKLWVHVLDIQFDFNPHFKCQRGEIVSAASAKRKLEQRVLESERKPLGKRADILVKDINSTREYAYGEASKVTDSTHTKNLMDSKLKTTKTMKDMMHVLSGDVGTNLLKDLRTVGFQCSRYTLTVMTMDHTLGYLMRVRKLPSVELELVKEGFVKSFCQLFKLANKGLLICRESANMVAQSTEEFEVDFDSYEEPSTAESSFIPSVLRTPPRITNPTSKRRRYNDH